MHVHVRGGLGFQILGLIGAMSESIANCDPISEVTLNFGHYPNAPIYGEKFKYDRNYLSEIFDLPFPVITQIGTEKYSFFRPLVIARVIRHLPAIREALSLKKTSYANSGHYHKTVVHVRHLDRHIVSHETYCHVMAVNPGCFIMTDDYESALYKFPGIPVSHNQEIDDWCNLARNIETRTVIGGVSSFTISAALLNPLLDLRIVSRDNSIEGPLTETDWESVRLLTELVPNISFAPSLSENRQ